MGVPSTVGNEITTIRELIDEMAGAQPEAPFLLSPETGQVLAFRAPPNAERDSGD